jgi:hypothetical protein
MEGRAVIDTSKPWPTLRVEGVDHVAITLDSVHGHLILRAWELAELCAAIELDRVQRPDMARLYAVRAHRGWTWADLMDGAFGLRTHHAPGHMTIEAALKKVGLVVVESEARVSEADKGVEHE